MEILAGEGALDPKYQDHALAGGYIGHRECHIQPDSLFFHSLVVLFKLGGVKNVKHPAPPSARPGFGP